MVGSVISGGDTICPAAGRPTALSSMASRLKLLTRIEHSLWTERRVGHLTDVSRQGFDVGFGKRWSVWGHLRRSSQGRTAVADDRDQIRVTDLVQGGAIGESMGRHAQVVVV